MNYNNYSSPTIAKLLSRYSDYEKALQGFVDLDKSIGGLSEWERVVLKMKCPYKLFTKDFLDRINPDPLSTSIINNIRNYLHFNRFNKEDCYYLLSDLKFYIHSYGKEKVDIYNSKIQTTRKNKISSLKLYHTTIERIHETRKLLIEKYNDYFSQYETINGFSNQKNGFDDVPLDSVVKYFKKYLVTTGYLEEADFNNYIKMAFIKQDKPTLKFTFKKVATKSKICGIFYHYYNVIAGKPFRKQKDYADLLENYFIGYSSVSSNFNKGTPIKE